MDIDKEYTPAPSMEVGSADKLPHHAVDGYPHNFFVWVRKPGDHVGTASKQITGAVATSHYKALAHLFKTNQPAFVALCERLMVEHKWAPSPGPSWKVCDVRDTAREVTAA